MNIINVILSASLSSIFAIFTISNFSNEKLNLKIIAKFLMIVLTFGTLICLFFDGSSRILLTILVTTFALYISLFYKNLYKSLYYTLVYEIFAFLCEVLLSVFIVSLTNLNLKNNYSLLMVVYSILVSILIFSISKIKCIDKLVIKFNNVLSKKHYEFIYIIIIVILMTLMMVSNFNNFEKDVTFYINVGMTIFVFLTLIYIIYNTIKKQKLENNYSEMMEYVQKYEKIINEQGKKNHEYNNQLMVIRGYANNKKKLEEYLDLIINEHKCGQNYTIRELSYFPDGGIKGLIYHKLSKMEENNIKYYMYVDKNIKNIFEEKLDVKTYQDITKLLGVFIDNAIDATKDADSKEIELDIKKQDNCIIITITNTFNENIDTKQIGKKGFTTKGKGHGYGLSIVKDIAKHNDNIETFNDIENLKFKQTIILYYKKEK